MSSGRAQPTMKKQPGLCSRKKEKFSAPIVTMGMRERDAYDSTEEGGEVKGWEMEGKAWSPSPQRFGRCGHGQDRSKPQEGCHLSRAEDSDCTKCYINLFGLVIWRYKQHHQRNDTMVGKRQLLESELFLKEMKHSNDFSISPTSSIIFKQHKILKEYWLYHSLWKRGYN